MSKKRKRQYERKTVVEVMIQSERPQKCIVEGNVNTGIITMKDEYGDAFSEENILVKRTRKRASSKMKGDKVVALINAMRPTLIVDNLLNDYDAIYAVDTNSKEHQGMWYSFGVCLKLESSCNSTIQYRRFRDVTSENSFQRYEMEQCVWNKIITEIQGEEAPDAHIALVVDCDLERIPLYNQHKEKIRNKGYLPDNFTLIYASADEHDCVFNDMIRMCDKLATKSLNMQLDALPGK
jgi:hypothetical protein